MTNASFYRLKFKTIDWLTNYLVGGQPLTWWLVFDIGGCLLIFLAGQNIIVNIRIRVHYIHKSCGQLSQLFNKKTQSSFELLELEIWAENRTVFELYDRFWLLRCCYHLNSKMTLLNLELLMKVLCLCLSFLYI